MDQPADQSVDQPACSLPAEELRARLALGLVDGVGPVRFRQLLKAFGSAAAVHRASRRELAEVVGPSAAEAIVQTDPDRAVSAARRILRELEGRAVVLGHPSYPRRLARSPDPPPVLYVVGRLHTNRAVAMVGCRAARRRFLDQARQMACDLAAEGFAVVSGGAYGIDAAAHLGALDCCVEHVGAPDRCSPDGTARRSSGSIDPGRTVCVLGGGLDQLYPDRHVPLFEDIARSGALVSPFRPGTWPKRGCFLSRNRVIAAMAQAVVVVEAGSRSGARSTARHGRALGRPVMAVRGSPGTARLIAEGASAVASAGDIIEFVEGRKTVSGEPRSLIDTQTSAVEGLTADETTVLQAVVLEKPRTSDTIVEKSGLPVSRVTAALTCLELAGLVVSVPGGRFQKV